MLRVSTGVDLGLRQYGKGIAVYELCALFGKRGERHGGGSGSREKVSINSKLSKVGGG